MSAQVMIVDDSALIRMQVRRALTSPGMEITEAVDGQEAWERVLTMPDLKVVVCDINMPRMNGLELLEKMSEAGLLDRVTVLVLTTEGQLEMIRRARALGAKGWLIKPFKADLLLSATRRVAVTGPA